MTDLLRICQRVYEGEVGILLPRQLLFFELNGNTEQERSDELSSFANDLFEQISPTGSSLTYHFIHWFCKVIRTPFSSQQMDRILKRCKWRACKR